MRTAVLERRQRYVALVNLSGETLADRAATLTAVLGGLPGIQARFAWLVEDARARPMLPDACRREEFQVPGCQVRTWLVPEFREGRCWFRLDSDAVTLKAVGGLLCDFYNGQTPAEIQRHSPGFLDQFSLGTNLAENRRRTVGRIRELIYEFAQAQLAATSCISEMA